MIYEKMLEAKRTAAGPLRNSYGVTNSHDFEMPFLNQDICGGTPDSKNLCDIINRICSAFGHFLFRAIPNLGHVNPLSIQKEQHENDGS